MLSSLSWRLRGWTGLMASRDGCGLRAALALLFRTAVRDGRLGAGIHAFGAVWRWRGRLCARSVALGGGRVSSWGFSRAAMGRDRSGL